MVTDTPQTFPGSIPPPGPQGTEPPILATPENKRPKKWLIVILVILLAITLGATSLFAYQNYRYRQQLIQKPQPTPSPTQTVTPTPSLPKESELTSLDETWNQYTYYQLGFSIKVPREMMLSYGSCKWNEKGGDHSYRPDRALVPVKIYEDKENNTVYIASEYYYELAGETTENYVTYFSECNKVLNSLERVRKELRAERGHYQQAWDIVVRDVANDNQLESFIKERYGSGCGLGEKTPSEQEGVFNVGIDTGGAKSFDEATGKDCVVNYMTVLRYYPAKNKVVSWHLGQDATFYKFLGAAGQKDIIYDSEMAESFRFLK